MLTSNDVLYSFRRCPYAIRARLAIASSEKTVALREIVLRDKPAEMLAASPKGTVPVLILADGTVIDESRDIIQWARPNAPSDGTLVDRNDTEFKGWLDKYKYSDRHPEQSKTFYRDQATAFLKTIDDILTNKNGLGDSKTTTTDLSIFPFVRQFAFVDKPWFDSTEYVHLQRWLDGWLSSDAFNGVMTKYPAWKPDDPPTQFP